MRQAFRQTGRSVSSPYSCFSWYGRALKGKLLPPLSRAWCAILPALLVPQVRITLKNTVRAQYV